MILYQIDALVLLQKVRCLVVELVLYIAHDLLEKVFKCDHPGGPTVFVDDDRDVGLGFFHQFERLVGLQGLGDEKRLALDALHKLAQNSAAQGAEKILGIEDTADLVDLPLVHGNAGMPGLEKDLRYILGVMRVCAALAALYPAVDREILLTAALFHDLGKAFELTHGFSREYTDAGRLIGHIQMGLEALEPFLRAAKDLPEGLAVHLKHLILSHHGELEFGSPRRPKTVEAFILHYADNLDAKINTVNTALENTADPEDVEASHWSEYHRTLGRYLY